MDRTAFFAALRRRTCGVFGTSLSQSQVDGINGILDAFATHGDGRDKTLAYALATAYHETGARMVPVREGFAKDDVSARWIVAKREYGQPAGKYDHVLYGRGQVQLTWLKNCDASSKDAGYDLVASASRATCFPSIANRPVSMPRGIIQERLERKRAISVLGSGFA